MFGAMLVRGTMAAIMIPAIQSAASARQVDYVSGASIALPTEVWHRMGGLDVAYRPAYCEDSDLAFRLRAAGYEVWFQPLSIAIHYEGKTHGRDLNTSGEWSKWQTCGVLGNAGALRWLHTALTSFLQIRKQTGWLVKGFCLSMR